MILDFTSSTSILYIILIIIVSLIGSYFVDKEYYKKIRENTPFWTPPPIVFGIVWFIIYLLFFFVFTINHENTILIFATLFFNIIWTFVFFNLKNKFLSFVIILIMLALSIYTYVCLTKELEKAKTNDLENVWYIELIMVLFLIYPLWLVVATGLTLCSMFLYH